MRKEVYEYIKSKKDLQRFIRLQPIWYKKLSRYPNQLPEFEKACKQYFHKTIPDRIEQVSNNVQMAAMMLNMLQAMNQKE